jgi:hypothetical protein
VCNELKSTSLHVCEAAHRSPGGTAVSLFHFFFLFFCFVVVLAFFAFCLPCAFPPLARMGRMKKRKKKRKEQRETPEADGETDDEKESEHYDKTTTTKMSLIAFCGFNKALAEALAKLAAQMRDLVVEAYHLIHLYQRLKYEKALDANTEPVETPWTFQRVLVFMYAVSVSAAKKQPKPPPADVQAAAEQYQKLRADAGFSPVSRDGLVGNMLAESARRIAANINTHVQQHFLEIQLRCLRMLGTGPMHSDQPADLSKVEALELQRRINANAASGNVKERHFSLPSGIENSVEYTLIAHPERFLFSLHKLNCCFERFGKRKNAVLPLATGFVPGAYLNIDTSTLRCLLNTVLKELKDKAKDYDAADKERKEKAKVQSEQQQQPQPQFDIGHIVYLQEQLKLQYDVLAHLQQLPEQEIQAVMVRQQQLLQHQLELLQLQVRHVLAQPQLQPLFHAPLHSHLACIHSTQETLPQM